MIEGVKALGLETCATLGMLTPAQALRLKRSGLDYYNHNLDTSPEFYGEIITTRTYKDRLDMLVQVEGTPLQGSGKLDPLEFVRTIAVARIAMPKSVVRLSAGREDMSEETQALCFLAGANSIFYGPKLLTTPNPGRDADMRLMDKLGMTRMG